MKHALIRGATLAAVLTAALAAQAEPQKGATIQLAQMSEDTRIQSFRPFNQPAPNTQPIGPVVRPFGSSDDSAGSRGGMSSGAETTRPPMGFGPTGSAPNQGQTTIPSDAQGPRDRAGVSAAER